ERFSTREAVLLGETIARQAGVEYQGEAARGFCARLAGDPAAITATIRHAAFRGMKSTCEKHFAEALAELLPDKNGPTLLAEFAAARRREDQAIVYQRILDGLATLTPAVEPWLAENGLPGARIPEVNFVTRESLPGGALFLAFGQQTLAIALL